MWRSRKDWFIYVRHPKYPAHGQLALLRGRNDTRRKVGAIFNERLNPLRPPNCLPPSRALFTIECYFPLVLGMGAAGIFKSASESAAKAELERQFIEFLEDVTHHE